MKITKHTVSELEYTLTNSNGMLLDTTKDREPILYLHGVGALIKGLEEALEGKEIGDKFQTNVVAKEAYGEFHDEMVYVVPKANFQGESEEDQLREGMQVQVDTNNGVTVALVTKIDGDDVTLDLNHPLAGMDLSFAVEVKSIRQATNEEIEHKHAHKEGSCAH